MTKKIIHNIQEAAEYLRKGDLVAFPTETVYGLGADAKNPTAIAKVFAAKGRPTNHPLIVHLADAAELNYWAQDIPSDAVRLANAFWPGPLTMILNKQPYVSSVITGGQDTIALRVPNHPLTLDLLKTFGSGLVGPSANVYGHVSPTTAEHVIHDLENKIAAVLDGGPCKIGIESTIVYLTANSTTIMRHGIISMEEIARVVHHPVAANANQQSKIRVSGSHAAHYAPTTPLYVDNLPNILKATQSYRLQQENIHVISFTPKPLNLAPEIAWHQVELDPHAFGRNFYAVLRKLDRLNFAAIFIEQPPQTAPWAAINDRLTRASAKHQV